MCSQICTALFLLVIFRLGSFAGDGMFLYSIIPELLRLANVFSRSLSPSPSPLGSSTYCNISVPNPTASTAFVYDILQNFQYSLVAYGVFVVISLLLTPPLIKFAIPSSNDIYGEFTADDNDDHSIDYNFRTKEKGGKRALRYLAITLPILIHDIPTCALGTYVVTSTVASDGPRCLECIFYDNTACQLPDFHDGWDKDLVYPKNNDYLWVGFLGGKLIGSIACIAVVTYFELQYRHHLHELEWQRQSQLLRIHFGQRRSESGKMLKYWGAWLVALTGTILVESFVSLMVLAPAITVMWFRLDFRLIPFLAEHLVITTYVSWSSWGIALLILVATTCAFAFCRKCSSDD